MEKKIGIITNIKSSPLTTNKEQCNIDIVSKSFVCGYWGSCNFKGKDNECNNKNECGSKKEAN